MTLTPELSEARERLSTFVIVLFRMKDALDVGNESNERVKLAGDSIREYSDRYRPDPTALKIFNLFGELTQGAKSGNDQELPLQIADLRILLEGRLDEFSGRIQDIDDGVYTDMPCHAHPR